MSAPDDTPPQRQRRNLAGWIAFAVVLVLGVVSWNLQTALWESAMFHEGAAFPVRSLEEIYSDANPTFLWSSRIAELWLLALLSMPVIAIVQFTRKRTNTGRHTVFLFLIALIYSFLALISSGDFVH